MPSQRNSKKEQRKASTTKLPLMIVAYLSIGLFFGLIVYMVYFQTMKSEALLNDPRNHRQELVEQET